MTHYHSEDENDLAGTPHPESQALNASALEAAIIAGNAECREYAIPEPHDGIYEVAIRAYLSASQEAAAPSEEPVAYAYVIDGDCEEIGWGKPPLEDPSLVLLFASPAVAPVAVGVKGLEWHGPDIRDEFTARSILGVFVINAKQRNGKRWCTGDYHDTLESAKAAAQADFNARILSSIIPATKGGEARDIADKLLDQLKATPISDPLAGAKNGKMVIIAMTGIRRILAALSAQDTDGVAK